MMRRMTGLLVGSCLAAVGCGQQQTVDSSSHHRVVDPAKVLLAQANPAVADVPMPVGFYLDESKSRSWQTGGVRFMDHLYKGREDKFNVWRFYKRQMPVNQWTLVRDIYTQGEVLLEFDKGNERCSIMLTNGSLFYPTYVKVLLSMAAKVDLGPAKR